MRVIWFLVKADKFLCSLSCHFLHLVNSQIGALNSKHFGVFKLSENKVFRVFPFLILPLICVYLRIWVSGLQATSILGFCCIFEVVYVVLFSNHACI